MVDRSLKEIFCVDEVLREKQDLVTIEPNTTVAEAIEIMQEHGFSALPVIKNRHVVGVFSFRSLALLLPEVTKMERDLMSVPVDTFVERYHFANIEDEMSQLFNEFDLREAILVGGEDDLLGMVTTVDALRYFYKVASPYIMLREVELAIRILIEKSVSKEILEVCIERSLGTHYREMGKDLPRQLEDLMFKDYVNMIGNGDNWRHFQLAFGGTRNITRTKLKDLPKLRNELFHFRRDITAIEYDELRVKRNWLLDRIRLADAAPDEFEKN